MAESSLLRGRGRKTVGLDMDGTLAASHEAILEEYNAEHGTGYTTEDFNTYSKWRIPMQFPEFASRHYDIWMNRWRKVRPSISPASMGKLVEAHEVDIVTYQSRPGYAEAMRLWCREFFPQVNVKIKITSSADEKAHMGYNVLLDDAPPLAEELIRRKGLKTVLIMVDQPWNRGENYSEHADRITRVKTLEHGIGLLVNGSILRHDRQPGARQRSRSR